MVTGNKNNDRRELVFDRRQRADRRLRQERRLDERNLVRLKRRLALRKWIKCLLNPRLGVDRRKVDQRSFEDRRGMNPASLLTQEELSALLEE